MTRLLLQFAAFLLILAAQPVPTCACSVPVFRYALERWPSDPYRVVVFHRGPLSKTQQLLAADMGPDGLAGEKSANVLVRTVDLDAKPDADMLALWKSQKNASLPWMVVRYPDTVKYAPAWSGPLTEANVDSLLGSPARRELAKRILAGETSVWLFLECGNKEQDDVAFARLEKQLKIEESLLKLPPIDDGDLLSGDAKTEIAKLKVRFSILRIPRDDPKEKLFAAMLLGSEGSGPESLRDAAYVNQPMAFPIFGRGRIRYGLVGDGIAEDTIHSTCVYLVGPCKCQIKTGVENRGMDLIMPVDWNRLVVTTIRDKPVPSLQGIGTFRDLMPQQPVEAKKPDRSQPQESKVSVDSMSSESTTAGAAVVAQPPDDAASSSSPMHEVSHGLTVILLAVFGVAAAVVAIATFIMMGRGKS